MIVKVEIGMASLADIGETARHELSIILTIFMLFPAMIMTAQYMIDKYSHTTQQTKETK